MHVDRSLFKIQFRRRSETGKFAATRWTFIVIAIVGLIYFAVSKIQELVKRDYVYVQHLKFLTEYPSLLPDILVCTTNVTSVNYDKVFSYTSYPIKGPSVPPGYYVRSPCLLPEHDTLYIFQFNQELPKRNIDEILRRITFETNSMTSIQFTLLHRGRNIYRKSNLYPNEVPDTRGGGEDGIHFESWDDIMYNNHYAQTGTTTYITSNSIFRWRLRSDIWGYFNFVSGTFPDAMVSSTIEAVATPGKTELVMIIPMTATEEVETLVVPISGALGSWGGVFSLVTTVYHLLFGVGKMSPFGYIQQFLMRSGTKRMIKKDYADEDKCLLGTRDTKEKGQHTHYPHKPPTEVAPFGDAPAYQMLDQEDSSRSNVQAEDINVTQILKQLQEQQEKLQEQQEKLALLHTAYEDVLQRLEEHEAKSRHSEHLIKGFYLDMEMIDEALESPETIQSTSINTAHRL